MKNIQQLARFFALLLAVVVANDHAGAMLVELKWGVPDHEKAGHLSTRTALHGNIPIGTSPLSDLLGLLAPEELRFIPSASPISAVSGDLYQRPANANAVATKDTPYLRPSGASLAPIITEKFLRHTVLSADMDWFIPEGRTRAETEDWLFLLQYADPEIDSTPGNPPLIPVPEPNTASLVICGIAGLTLKRLYVLGRHSS